MATTTGGTPYVQSSDLVSGWPTSSLAVGNHVDLIAGGDIAYSTSSRTATVAQILGNKVIVQNSASATVVTLPSSALVNGMQLKVVSIGAGAVTFTGGTVTGSTVSIATQYTGLTLLYYSAVWYAVPFTSGSAKASVSATTGSPTITTVGSKTCYKFTGSGSITTTAGTAALFIVGGGGGGGVAGGGAGGVVDGQDPGQAHNLLAGTHTVTVGAGGAMFTPGIASSVSNQMTAFGGGGAYYQASSDNVVPGQGGSGAGAYRLATVGPGVTNPGKNGGAWISGSNAGGGGGATAVGTSSGTAGAGGSGGAGYTSSPTGSSVTYAGGGGAWGNVSQGAGGAGGGGNGSVSSPTAGAANSGGGGGGGSSTLGNSGGSGVVIILIG